LRTDVKDQLVSFIMHIRQPGCRYEQVLSGYSNLLFSRQFQAGTELDKYPQIEAQQITSGSSQYHPTVAAPKKLPTQLSGST
jgi:hypothetical protein